MKLQFIEKFVNSPDIISFLFRPEGSLDFKPGQFLRYYIADPSPDERGENRFFSIASAPFEKNIKLTTKLDPKNGSTFKNDLQMLKVGEKVEATGPSGSFTIEDPNLKYVFIAGGIGITPFRSILLDLDHRGEKLNVTLIYASRTKDALFKKELENLSGKHPEFKIYFIVSEEPVIETQITNNIKTIPGRIDEVILKSLILNLKSLIYYISGPEPMVASFEEMLANLGVPKENIKRDSFPGYENY